MKLQKIILCAAIAVTAFGASVGLLEIGAYLREALTPIRVELKPLETVQLPIGYQPPRIPDFPPPSYTPPPAVSEPQEDESEVVDWGFTGDYYIIDDNPEGFEDFLNLTISDHEYDEKSEEVVKIKPEGTIDIQDPKRDDVKTFKLMSIDIKGQKILLISQTKKGVSYQLDGKFVEQDVIRKDENGEEYTETVYLKGRLSKWRDGKKIAEANVRFGISHGC